MKKLFNKTIIIVALIAFVVMAGCKKENYNGMLMLSAEGYQSNDKVAVDGTTTIWATGDEVNLNGNTYPVTVSDGKAYVNAPESVASADIIYAYTPASIISTFSGTNTQNVTIPSTYLSSFDGNGNQIIDMPMAARTVASGGSITFKHITASVLVRVKNSTTSTMIIDSVRVYSPYQISGSRQINLNDGSLGLGTLPNSYAPQGSRDRYACVVFSDNNAVISAGGVRNVHVPVLPFKGGNATVEVYSHNSITGASCDISYTFSYNASIGSNIHRNTLVIAQIQIYPSSSKVTTEGLFMVSPNKYICFSKGNLQYRGDYHGDNPHWNFAENQYDVIYDANGAGNGTVIDVFGWACNGINNGQVGYSPRYNNGSNSNYYYGNDLSGSTDWGYNPIENGGNESGYWRTLTKDEWVYLLTERPYNGSRKGTATVNGRFGLVLLPSDNWVLPAGLSFTSGINSAPTNEYTADQWLLMEDAGAVFLPITGYRGGSNFSSNGACVYWSASRSSDYKAYSVYTNGTSFNASTTYDIYRGQAVRLVRDIE